MIIEDIIKKIAKTPGITRRSAQKMIINFATNKLDLDVFLQALDTIRSDVKVCNTCNNIAFQEQCAICANEKRGRNIVCVVESFDDIINLEKGMWYNGLYHVLGGLLSAQKGMMPDSLNIQNLLHRIKNQNIKEVVFASTSSFEWKATMHFITEEIHGIIKKDDIKITEFAHGMPIGGSFEFMDEGTLQIAYSKRNILQ